MWHSFDACAEAMNRTGLWVAELFWYSPTVNRCIYRNSFDHGLGIYGYRRIRPCLLVEVLATRAESSWIFCLLYCDQLHLHLSLFFFCAVIAQFELIKDKFQNQTTKLHFHLSRFQIIHRMKRITTCQRTNYHDTANFSRALTASVIWYIRCQQAHH